MALEIKPGQWITIKILSQPRTAAGVKTLVRLFEQDAAVRRERRRLNKSRIVRSHIRGGRSWKDRPPRLQLVKTKPGATCRIFGTVPVLRDLKKLNKYVEISPA